MHDASPPDSPMVDVASLAAPRLEVNGNVVFVQPCPEDWPTED